MRFSVWTCSYSCFRSAGPPSLAAVLWIAGSMDPIASTVRPSPLPVGVCPRLQQQLAPPALLEPPPDQGVQWDVTRGCKQLALCLSEFAGKALAEYCRPFVLTLIYCSAGKVRHHLGRERSGGPCRQGKRASGRVVHLMAFVLWYHV